ncbi:MULTISPECIES: hypothetical protein [Streptomyces]|jgi:hypothetical protein|uniref:Histidine kinase n=1 Tax=Streptomyces doudnae TaxID=3075536 RepID=A0ABD5EFQ4_9ACTN|nr:MULTISPECIES: hypothetical protein [unclassified Streptomyces]MDT0433435.1 hypothetical protein [Streptomyces sp. DSM 41981]MYQ65566.1 hypothetical protein [Streptomyces sp. SID4950]SCE02666.1 hypothetical protein GA0115242_11999 [Streptomyces sp. SolWspMP-5a-2]
MDDLSATGGGEPFDAQEPALGLLDGELREAASVLDPVPTALEQLAVEAFALHDLDARIAELTFDSVVDAIPVRGAVDVPRMLTFHADGLTVDVELTGHGLLGQVLPPQTAAIEVLSGPRAGSALTTDALGRFASEEPPSGPFALRLRTGGGVLVTDWLTA